MNLPTKMSLELIAISMIGDGMLALLQPQRHMRLWNAGPEQWRQLCAYFEERPVQTMAVGAGFVALGLWLASRQDQPARGADSDQDRDELPGGVAGTALSRSDAENTVAPAT